METKEQIRKQFLSIRSAMKQEEILFHSEEIANNIVTYMKTCKNLKEKGCLSYYPRQSEVSLLKVYDYLLAENIPLAFPKVKGNDMEFYQIMSMDEFERGSFQILEPKMDCPMVMWEDALCLVPGAVFDKQGNRFGYGKGYYDNYCSRHEKMLRIGIAYKKQIAEELPVTKRDIPMDGICSEDGLVWI